MENQHPEPTGSTQQPTGQPADVSQEAEVSNAPEIPPPSDQQRNSIKALIDAANQEGLVEGKTYSLVPTKWFRRWKSFTGYESGYSNENDAPGPIDNSDLLETVDGELVVKKTLSEMWDYEILPHDAYRCLASWYGGGPEITRQAILLPGRWKTEVVVELRPLRLLVRKSSEIEKEIPAWFSKASTVEHFANEMCSKFSLSRENVRIWDFHGATRHKLLEQTEKSLEEAMIIDGNKMLLEEKNTDGKWPEVVRTYSSYNSSYSSSSYSGYNYGSSRSPSDPGKVGLGNLGNTCFMNSALQCLSSTAPLTDFFLSGKYLTDLNPDNPLGMNGEIAKEYGKLLKELWSGETYAAEPRSFKWTLQRFAPQFEGYQQHDSQELLAFLLDGLHEDLNRILRKPYVAAIESEGRPDAEVAKLSWDGHKSRNDSIIVDLFQGQLKSRVQCPVCPRVSITFDPFMYLSLPLPMKSTRPLVVTLRRQNGELPTKYQISPDKAASVLDFKRQLASLAGISDPHRLILVDVYNKRFYREIKSEEALDTISDNDILWAYEIDLPELPEPDSDEEESLSAEKESKLVSIAVLQATGRLVNFPFVISAESSITYADLYAKIVRCLTPYLKSTPGPLSAEEYPSSTSVEEENEDVPLNDPPGAGASDSDEEVTVPMKPRTEQKRGPRWGGIFEICSSDEYGSISNRNRYVNDDSPMELDQRQHLCLLWSEETLEEYWNDEATRSVHLHPSMSRRDRDDDAESRSNISLKECIQLFTTEETLGANDMWYCGSCKEHRQAHKKMDLWTLPPVLVIHLKRFSYKSRYNREKIDMVVDFPLEGLDLSEYLPEGQYESGTPPLYDLFAVSNHFGSMGGGHYTAYAKHRSDGKWYNYDDRSVSSVSDPNSVKTAAAYVLFYRRRDVAAFSKPFSKSTPETEQQADSESEDEQPDAATTSAPGQDQETQEISL